MLGVVDVDASALRLSETVELMDTDTLPLTVREGDCEPETVTDTDKLVLFDAVVVPLALAVDDELAVGDTEVLEVLEILEDPLGLALGDPDGLTVIDCVADAD